jgi:sugar-specific transcriptional regulator TrmB
MPRRGLPDIDESTRQLVDLGLTLNEARCYVTLLHIAPATAGEVADASGVPRPKVYGTLKSLEQRSFCYASGDRVTTFRPVDPELALGEWTRRREHERRLADEHDRRLRGALVSDLPDPPEHMTEDMSEIMQLTGGPRQTIEVYERLIENAERQLDIVHSAPVLQAQSRWNVYETAALDRGVQVRVLFATDRLAIEHGYEQILQAGGEVRVARGMPLKLIVRDNGTEALVALHNLADEAHPTCVAIRHADLVAPIQLLFNREWRQARALEPAPSNDGRRRRSVRS